jgi:hypothetical protein
MDEESPPPASKPSQVPSWVLLGFGLGALFVLALPKHAAVESESRLAAEIPAPTPARALTPPLVSTIEAVFTVWGKYAVWNNDTTEVALWNSEAKAYSDCYEVLKMGDDYYFRSITRLTRPILAHGVPEGCPLQFTETLRQREDWLAEVGKENMRAMAEGVQQSLAAPTVAPQKP